MLKKFLLVFFLVILHAGCAFSEVSINDISGLISIKSNLNGNYRLDSDIQISAAYDWEPIGSASAPFTGTFDGNGHIIYIRIEPFSTNDERLLLFDRALFGFIRGGTVRNLNVAGTARGYNAAGIVSTLDSGTISNCRFTGNAEVNSVLFNPEAERTKINAGGIAARLLRGTIENCNFSGNITASCTTGEIYANAGGIVGRMSAGDIINCYVNQEAVITSKGGGSASGGIAAYAVMGLSDKISECTFDGSAISEYSAGGIIGTVNGGMITDNDILGNSRINGSYRAGGVAGIIEAASAVKGNRVYPGAQVSGNARSAGGIAGYLGEGEVVEVSGNISHAEIGGSAPYRGGIIGEIHNHTGASKGIGRDENGNRLVDLPGIVNVDSELAITTIGHLEARISARFSQNFMTNSDSPVTWTYSGSIPGLEFNSGTLAGIPLTEGTFNFSLTASAGGKTASKDFTLTVKPAFEITPEYMPPAKVNEFFTQDLMINPEPAQNISVNWIINDALPAGLNYSYADNHTLRISGTPYDYGTFSVDISAAVDGITKSKNYVFYIEPAISIEGANSENLDAQAAKIGELYRLQLIVKGYEQERTSWRLTGTVPAGLSINQSSGLISGTPETGGNYAFTVIAEINSASGVLRTEREINIDVAYGIIILTSSLPSGTVNLAYPPSGFSANLRSSPEADYWYDNGRLPPGLSLSRSGAISGTPELAGNYSFDVYAVLGNVSDSRNLSILIAPSFSIITPETLPPGKLNERYADYNLTANMTSGVTWSIISGDISQFGLSLSSVGVISGIPSKITNGDYEFQVQASYNGLTAIRTFRISIADVLTISTVSLPDGMVSTDYRFVLAANMPSVEWSEYGNSGILSELGLTLASDGTITGMPSKAGTFYFTIQAKSGGLTAIRNFTLTIARYSSVEILTSQSDIHDGKINENYSFTFSANPPNSYWRIIAGNLPSGLVIDNSTGNVSGIPSEAKTFEFTLQAYSGDKASTPKSFSIAVNPSISIITTSPLPDGMVSEDYSCTLRTNDPSQNVTWQTVSNLPLGLSLSSSGIISGKPVLSGTYAFTVRVNDASGKMLDVKDFSLRIAQSSAFSIVTDSLPSGRTGESYSYMLSVNPPSARNLTWYIISGDLPYGLTLDKDSGIISGIPTLAGSFDFTVRASSGDMIASKNLSLSVSSSISISTSSPLPPAKINEPYEQTLAINSGLAIWEIISGILPIGLTLNSSGQITGVPLEIGTFNFTVQAQSEGIIARKDFALTVRPMLSITTSSDLPSVKVNTFYSFALETDAEQSEQVSWSVIAGLLPYGLTLDANTGIISGFPEAENVYAFTVQAISGSLTASKVFRLAVNPQLEILTSSPLPSGKIGQNYSCTFIADSENVSWSMTGGTLPAGLAFTSGTLAGIPSEAGTFIFTIQANSENLESSKEFLITIRPALSIMTASMLPSGKIGASYSFTLSTDAGSDIIPLWSALDLPEGLAIDRTTGTISGIPEVEGTYAFTVQASVSGSSIITANKEFLLTIRPAISIITEALPPVRTDREYYTSLRTDADEDKIVAWNLIGGNLPFGLELDGETGIISGYSEAEGNYEVTIQAVSGNLWVNRDFVLNVGNEITIANASEFPAVDAGSSFSQTLAIYNSDRTANWSIISGNFPTGLTLNPLTGTISGSPITAGTYTFTIQAQSGTSFTSKTFTLTIRLAISNDAYLPNATAGESYEQRLKVNGANSDNIIWSADAKLLPAGLTLRDDGIISGIPSSPGVSNFTVYVSADNAKTQKAMRITVDSFSAVPIITTSLQTGKVGGEYLAELRTTLEGVMWSQTRGTLPPGLSLSSSGIIFGTPEEAGVFTFTVRAATQTREGLRQLTIIIEPSSPSSIEVEESEDIEPFMPGSAGSSGGCNVSGTGIILLALIFFMLTLRDKRVLFVAD